MAKISIVVENSNIYHIINLIRYTFLGYKVIIINCLPWLLRHRNRLWFQNQNKPFPIYNGTIFTVMTVSTDGIPIDQQVNHDIISVQSISEIIFDK